MKKKANGESEDLPPEHEFDFTKGKPNRFTRSNGDRKEVVPDPELKITTIQDLQLQIIALTNYNNCDGRKINRLLRENRHLWRAAMMPNKQLYPLRDMEEGFWSADTLYLFPRAGKEFELEELVKEQFNADEITWIGSDQSLDLLGYWKKDEVQNPKMILSVWWD
jgi:hypothetical protein